MNGFAPIKAISDEERERLRNTWNREEQAGLGLKMSRVGCLKDLIAARDGQKQWKDRVVGCLKDLIAARGFQRRERVESLEQLILAAARSRGRAFPKPLAERTVKCDGRRTTTKKKTVEIDAQGRITSTTITTTNNTVYTQYPSFSTTKKKIVEIGAQGGITSMSIATSNNVAHSDGGARDFNRSTRSFQKPWIRSSVPRI